MYAQSAPDRSIQLCACGLSAVNRRSMRNALVPGRTRSPAAKISRAEPVLREYFKRKGDRETLAPEGGYGKYKSNMADDEWLCMPSKRSYGGGLR